MDDTRATRPLIAIEPHTRTYPDPIAVTRGERVSAGERDTFGGHEGAWIWCTSAAGKSGWVPEQYLAVEGGEATVLEDRDTIELTVAVGERLLGAQPVNGWVWCVNEVEDAGWVPLNNLRAADPEPRS